MTSGSPSGKQELLTGRLPDTMRLSLAGLWVRDLLGSPLVFAVRTVLHALWCTMAFAAYAVFTGAEPVLALASAFWTAAPAGVAAGALLALLQAGLDASRRIGKVRHLLRERLQQESSRDRSGNVPR